MFLLVIHVVLLPTQHLCFDLQKFYWAYAASPVHIMYGRRAGYTKKYYYFKNDGMKNGDPAYLRER